jgi:hypothetical protein
MIADASDMPAPVNKAGVNDPVCCTIKPVITGANAPPV